MGDKDEAGMTNGFTWWREWDKNPGNEVEWVERSSWQSGRSQMVEKGTIHEKGESLIERSSSP